MTIGLSTYAFFWRRSPRVAEPMDLLGLVEETARAGCEVLQICDARELAELSPDVLRDLRTAAAGQGIALELGVRGTTVARMHRHLELARQLGATLVRTMVLPDELAEGISRVEGTLREVLPRCEDLGVTVALETYEVVETDVLVALVESLASKRLGICLDPANVVARLEHPSSAIARAAGCTVNLHVKDFRFERAPGLVGFSLTGCPLGTGQLDLAYLYAMVRPRERDISEIVEHWLPWLGDEQSTLRAEREWTARSLEVMRSTATGSREERQPAGAPPGAST